MDIIVTTGDIKEAYKILQPIFVQISNKGVLKNHFDQLELKHQALLKTLREKTLLPMDSVAKKRGSLGVHDIQADATGARMEKAFYIALEELKQHAKSLGGNAVVAMRYETDLLANPNGEFYLQMYGTAVQIEEQA